MLPGDCRDFDTAQHPRQFLDSSRLVKLYNPTSNHTVLRALAHLPLPICTRCHLRQMRHAQNLPLCAQFAQQSAHDLGDTATDTHINLVENQRRNARCLAGHDLNRQADTRQFATRSHLCQALERLAGVGADQQFDLLQAMR